MWDSSGLNGCLYLLCFNLSVKEPLIESWMNIPNILNLYLFYPDLIRDSLSEFAAFL